MSGGPATVSWLNLHVHGIPRDVRKIIYGKLEPVDRMMVEIAHTPVYAFLFCDPAFGLVVSVYCAKHGYETLLRWWISIGGDVSWKAMNLAAGYGRVEIMEMIRVAYIWPDEGAGTIDIELHHQIINGPFEAAYNAATLRGHLNVIEHLYKTVVTSRATLRYVECLAAREGHLHILKWLHTKTQICYQTLIRATECGHLNVIVWLITVVKLDPTQDIWEIASNSEHIHILKWLFENNHPISSSFLFAACRKGNVNVLQFALENNLWSDTDPYYCASVATGNLHLNVLEWLIDAKLCKLHNTLALQLMRGREEHLPILDWLYKRGCPIDVEIGWQLASYKVKEWLNKTFRLGRNIYEEVD